jgi:hypothetical protein
MFIIAATLRGFLEDAGGGPLALLPDKFNIYIKPYNRYHVILTKAQYPASF